MAISAALVVTPANPAKGGTVTATYSSTGNTGTPAVPGVTGSVTGDVTFDSPTDTAPRLVVHTVTTLKLPDTDAVPPFVETYSVPVFPGLTFVVSPTDPKVFTATVPK